MMETNHLSKAIMQCNVSSLQITGHLPHVLVLNKRDLIPPKQQKVVEAAVRRHDPDLSKVIFTNCKDSRDRGLRKVSFKTINDLSITMSFMK